MNSALEMMDFVLKMMGFVFQMMILLQMDRGPCPFYSHFWWRKPLNGGVFYADPYCFPAVFMLKILDLTGGYIGRVDAPVPADTYYACEHPITLLLLRRLDLQGDLFQDCLCFPPDGGDGQFAVVVPSLDLVVVSQCGGRVAELVPPTDWKAYNGHQYFPQPGDKFMQVGDDAGGFGKSESTDGPAAYVVHVCCTSMLYVVCCMLYCCTFRRSC